MKKLFCLLLSLLTIALVSCTEETTTTVQTETTTIITTSTTNEVTTTPVCVYPEILYEGTCRTDLLDGHEEYLGETYTLSDLEYDYDYIVNILSGANPQIFADEEEIDSLIESQRELLYDGMSEIEFLRVLAVVVGALNCGHSGISPSSVTGTEFASSDGFFPLRLYMYEDDVYVISNELADDVPLGSKINQINGIDIDIIIEELFKRINSDGTNMTLKYNAVSDHFFYYYKLFMNSTDRFVLSYYTPDSEELSYTILDGASQTSISQSFYSNESWNPLDYRIESNYAYLQVGTFSNQMFTLTEFSEYIDDFFLQVEEQNIGSLIIDLRGNGGGDPSFSKYLFEYILGTVQPYFSSDTTYYLDSFHLDMLYREPHFEGDIYVLIDGGCFSTTGHFLALVKYQEIATIIGEESGGGYICTDNSRSYYLTYTRIILRSSRQAYAVRVEGLDFGVGIQPDIELIPTVENILDNEDVVLDYAIGLIEE